LHGIKSALAIPGANLHLYGKSEVRMGRKMGHVTVLGDTAEGCERLARQAADLVDL
jgi:5-(carboxyamino)imidazole ribonucleotide synthase